MARKPGKSLTGQTFGRLLAGEKVIARKRNGARDVRWSCTCACGKLVAVTTSNLQRGNTRSCGCLTASRRSPKPYVLMDERANPFTKRGHGYVEGISAWRPPYLLDEPVTDGFQDMVAKADDVSKLRYLAMLYRVGNSPEQTAACFGTSVRELDEWIRALDPNIVSAHIEKRINRTAKRQAKLQKRRDADPTIAFRRAFSIRMWHALRTSKPGKSFDILPYTFGDLVAHIESQFRPGMTWENYGRVWHLDHKRPVSWFDWKGPDLSAVIRDCWALSNLQPLWKAENIAKGNRYAHE